MASLECSFIEPQEPLSALLERFRLPCHAEAMTWGEAWGRLTRIALYRLGPDVSQIGTTWLDSLVDSGAVRPFTDGEIEALGGPSVFLPASWQTASLPPPMTRVWAIPWQADVRVVFYWRDMLEEAGVDGQTAFETPERVEETMSLLQASGIATPWGIFANAVNLTLQNVASWVWGAGGDFISADGKQILFDRPEAMGGFMAYLRLHRYMPPNPDHLVGDSPIVDMFAARRVAVVMGPCIWFEEVTRVLDQAPDVAARIGVAMPPGPAFVGGSNLIVWQHTHQPEDAVALVHFLTSKQAQADHSRAVGYLPVRSDVASEPPYTTDARYQVMLEALKTGRSFSVVPKWGAVEDRLNQGLIWLWDTLLADPDQDVEGLTKPYLDSIKQRLTVTLGLRE